MNGTARHLNPHVKPLFGAADNLGIEVGLVLADGFGEEVAALAQDEAQSIRKRAVVRLAEDQQQGPFGTFGTILQGRGDRIQPYRLGFDRDVLVGDLGRLGQFDALGAEGAQNRVEGAGRAHGRRHRRHQNPGEVVSETVSLLGEPVANVCHTLAKHARNREGLTAAQRQQEMAGIGIEPGKREFCTIAPQLVMAQETLNRDLVEFFLDLNRDIVVGQGRGTRKGSRIEAGLGQGEQGETVEFEGVGLEAGGEIAAHQPLLQSEAGQLV